MASVLKIDGATVGRGANRVVLDRLTLSLEGYDVLEFSQVATILPGSYTAARSVELEVDGATRFKGQIASSHYQAVGSGPLRIGYRAFGLEWLANRIPITGGDGTGTLLYNLPREDDDYIPSLAGRSVGWILGDVFTRHAAELAAIGVTGWEPADLAALTVTPRDPVHLSGGLWGMVRALLSQWCNKYAAWIEPADGKIRVASQLGGLTPLTLTLDADPITVESLSRDHSECYTRLVLRGGPDVQAAYLTSEDGGWAKGWTGPQEADWTYADYLQPRDSADVGAITAVGSTTLTVQSDEPAREWDANFWAGVAAEVVAYDPVATGITYSESRRIVSNTAMTAGGTSVLTLDSPLNNSGYERYSIRGVYSDAAKVWRKLNVVPAYVRDHLVKRFSHDVPWSPVDGAVVMTRSAQAVVCHSAGCSRPWNEWPVTFEVDPTTGSLWFHEPVVKPFSSMASLEAGTPDGVPCEVKVQVPYSRGAMSITLPASGHEGTAHTVDGLERTAYKEYPGWLDYRDRASYEQLAREVLDTLMDTVVEGSLTYHGKLSAALAKGVSLNLAGAGYATGFEAANATVRQVVLDYAPDGGSASEWTTRLMFSNRLRPFSGDRLYAHPGFGSTGWRPDAGLDYEGAAKRMQQAQAQARARPASAGGPEPSLDPGPVGPNRYRKPGKDTGLSADARKRVRGEDKDYNAMQADDRENARRTAARGSRRHAQALTGALGKDPTRNAVEADDRESRRRLAEKGSRRHSARLSNALGNPLGKDSSEADRRTDAMLKALADGSDDDRRRRRGGGTGIGIAYP